MNMDAKESGAFTVDEAAKYCGVSRPTFFSWLQQGTVPAFKSGRRWVIPREALTQWLNERAQERAQL